MSEPSRDPCTELLEHFRKAELHADIEGRLEMGVVIMVAVIVTICFAFALSADFIAGIATLPEIGAIGIHHRRAIGRLLLYRRKEEVKE